MRVVAAIFDRQHRLHHARGNRGEWNLAALLSACADERGQHRRVERDGRFRARRFWSGDRQRFDAIAEWRRRRGAPAAPRLWNDPAAPEIHHDGLAGLRPGSRHDGDDAAGDRKFAGCLHQRPLRVAEIVEAIDQLALRYAFAPPNFERAREYARQHSICFTMEPRVDHP